VLCVLTLESGKKSISPLTYEGWNTSPQPMKMDEKVYFTPNL
jgi:hypothetical protein